MDEATLEATIDAYRQQLQQIETVLQSAGSEGLDDLLQLQKDLKEVIELTQGSLLSLRKSNLLSYIDDISDPSSKQSNGNADENAAEEKSIAPDFDEEFAAFQAAIADETGTPPTVENSSAASKHSPTQTRDHAGDNSDDEDDDDGESLEGIAGTKCSIIHRHEWGGQQRQNAVVFSVEPPSPDDDEVQVRVLFCNPTNASMKPCPFYFKGECRFDEEECRFSHGHVVKVSELVPFQEVDLSQLKLESKCMAKYEDDIWYPAEIIDIDPDTHQVTVCFESYGNSSTLNIQDILPSSTQDESSDEDFDQDGDDVDDDGSSSELSDRDAPSTSSASRIGGVATSRDEDGEEQDEEEKNGVDVLWMPSGPSCRLGEWEAHTRGIASKLMAKMGYEVGKGLGKRGEGRTEPVEAVIVPRGKSLDECMKLRERKKLGIVGKKKKRRGGKRKKKKKQSTSGDIISRNKLRKAKDVFEFINTHLGAKKIKVNELLTDNFHLVKSHRVHREANKQEQAANTRQLNVQLLKTQEEVRSSEKRIKHLKQSLTRNQRDKTACASIQATISKTEGYLTTLKTSQRKLERQKTSRDEHKKLTIF